MDIAAVLNAIVAGINGSTLQGQTLRVVATATIPDAPEPPAFYPYTWQLAYDHDFSGDGELTITAHLLLSRADTATGQQDAQKLAGMGTNGIRSVIQSLRHNNPDGKGLSGACADLRLTNAAGPRQFTMPDSTNFWGVEFTIFVFD